MQIAFISDLHLSPNTPDKNQLFYCLLQKFVDDKFDALYILGDFFDYWLGDDDINEFSQAMINKFTQATKHLKIYFLHGNHEFAIGKVFCQQTGIQRIQDMTTLYTGEHKILLSHGDTFCTLDLGYQKMKRIIQNPVVIAILRKLPLSMRYKIKALMERGSHATNHKTPKPPETYHVVDSAIIDFADKYGADTIIHGHTHRPGHYSIQRAEASRLNRYETPDWEDHEAGGYLVYSNNCFKFEHHR